MITNHRRWKYTPEQRLALVAAIQDLLKEGMTKQEIAKKLFIPYGTITSLYFRYVKHGIPKM